MTKIKSKGFWDHLKNRKAVSSALSWAHKAKPYRFRQNSDNHIESRIPAETYQHDTPSIAILPFNDFSTKGNQTHFCEGIAEEILIVLSKVANLRVSSRAAAFHLDGRHADIAEIGKKLKVRTVLEGSVWKSDDKLRITSQLTSTADGFHLWTKQYDQALADIFDIQEDIVNSVTNALGVPGENQVKVTHLEVDPKAYDFFLRGMSYFSKHTTQDNIYARQMFNQAIAIEPEFGRAWTGVAYTYGFSYMYFNASDVNLAEAKRTSEKALEFAAELPKSHVAAGIAYCMDQQYASAEEEFEKAIELDPKNYEAWYFFGRTKVHEGDLRRALKLFERASGVRPEDFQSVLLQAQLYTSLKRKSRALEVTGEGIKRARAALDLNPEDNRALNMGAFALLRLGEQEEAMKWMISSLKNAPMDSIIQYNGACFFSLAGEADRALDCLENCLIKVGNISREWLDHDSDMDNIRKHPRFEEVISNFPE